MAPNMTANIDCYRVGGSTQRILFIVLAIMAIVSYSSSSSAFRLEVVVAVARSSSGGAKVLMVGLRIAA